MDPARLAPHWVLIVLGMACCSRPESQAPSHIALTPKHHSVALCSHAHIAYSSLPGPRKYVTSQAFRLLLTALGNYSTYFWRPGQSCYTSDTCPLGMGLVARPRCRGLRSHEGPSEATGRLVEAAATFGLVLVYRLPEPTGSSLKM